MDCGYLIPDPLFFSYRTPERRGEPSALKAGALMFMGEYNHSIDEKGRLIIPSRFRELLGEEFILTKGLDGCLSIFPQEEWEPFVEKLRALPLASKDARTFSRFFVSGACTCSLDKQGRILVPPTLREFAGLTKDVVIAGNLNRIEVWSREAWSRNCDFDDMDTIAAGLQKMGIMI